MRVYAIGTGQDVNDSRTSAVPVTLILALPRHDAQRVDPLFASSG
jgi:hypothetical protein